MTKYGEFFNAQVYADWLPIAIARSAIFPIDFRDLAVEFYHGYLLCVTSSDRQASEVKSFDVNPEGYSVTYADKAPKCSDWIDRLRQLGVAASVEIPELKKVTALGSNRVDQFNHDF